MNKKRMIMHAKILIKKTIFCFVAAAIGVVLAVDVTLPFVVIGAVVVLVAAVVVLLVVVDVQAMPQQQNYFSSFYHHQ